MSRASILSLCGEAALRLVSLGLLLEQRADSEAGGRPSGAVAAVAARPAGSEFGAALVWADGKL